MNPNDSRIRKRKGDIKKPCRWPIVIEVAMAFAVHEYIREFSLIIGK